MKKRIKISRINHILILSFLLIPMGLKAQKSSITISGAVKDKTLNQALPFVNVVLEARADSSFVAGTITNDGGRFTLS